MEDSATLGRTTADPIPTSPKREPIPLASTSVSPNNPAARKRAHVPSNSYSDPASVSPLTSTRLLYEEEGGTSAVDITGGGGFVDTRTLEAGPVLGFSSGMDVPVGGSVSHPKGVKTSASMEKLASWTFSGEEDGRRGLTSRQKTTTYDMKLIVYYAVRIGSGLLFIIICFATFDSVSGFFGSSNVDASTTASSSSEQSQSSYKPGILYSNRLKNSLYDAISLNTVAYPISTHPRTPSLNDDIALDEYLITRLGSSYSSPDSDQENQLWVSTATEQSLEMSGKHLGAFIDGLNLGDSLSSGTRNRVSKVEAPAKRVLLLLCLDEGCLEKCRAEGMYCYSGTSKVGRNGKLQTVDKEVVRLRSIIEILESGRRTFLIDDDVYFRHDPALHLADLDEYDLQIPGSWSTANTRAGFVSLNPTRHVISLYRRMLQIHSLTEFELETPLSWASTNLLLDPEGLSRGGESETISNRLAKGAEGEFGGFEDWTMQDLYGQSEFLSTWAGGLTVKVLPHKKFRSTLGLREGGVGDGDQALYMHCACCTDPISTDYLAGHLGFHHPSIALTVDQPKTSTLPSVPRLLTFAINTGDTASLSFALGLLMQASVDSGRSFLPPSELSITSPSSTSESKAIWEVYPLAFWAQHLLTSDATKKTLPSTLSVLSPHFISHAVSHLKSQHLSKSSALATSLQETLWLDVSSYDSYKAMLKALSQSYFLTTQVVTLEGIEKVRGLKKWELREEFRELQTCYVEEGKEKEEEEKCEKICRSWPTKEI